MYMARLDAGLARILLAAALIVVAIMAGTRIGEWVMAGLNFHLVPSNEPMLHRMVMAALAIYIVLMALPFCPGIEIGLGMILLFGAPIVPLVYGATVAALLVAFLIGRFVPSRLIIGAFNALRLHRAGDLLRRMEPLDASERLALLQGSSSNRLRSALLRYRYIAVAVALNTPGNIVLGDGGGIAMVAGFSRLFSPGAFALTVVLAVAPVPLAILIADG